MGGFSDTSGSVRLGLVTQPARGYNSSSQCSSRLTEVYLAVNKGGLFVLMPNAECLRGMRHDSLDFFNLQRCLRAAGMLRTKACKSLGLNCCFPG